MNLLITKGNIKLKASLHPFYPYKTVRLLIQNSKIEAGEKLQSFKYGGHNECTLESSSEIKSLKLRQLDYCIVMMHQGEKNLFAKNAKSQHGPKLTNTTAVHLQFCPKIFQNISSSGLTQTHSVDCPE